ncbi:MAG TPA: alpha/beta hydrolase, partial [Paracoccaceae bacterium]
MDRAYANAAVIPGAADYPRHWAAVAAGFRAALGDRARL